MEPAVTPEFVERFLSLPALDERTELLRGAGVLNAEGLDRLLDFTERLARGDPGTANRLAELCAEVAERADAPAAVPRASYIRVRVHNERGEFDAALRMVRDAHEGYAALGMNLEALRTRLGTMVTLLEQGRYQEALDTGQTVLDALREPEKSGIKPERGEAALLTALVQQNRGRCLEYMGHYDETLEAYESAEENYRTLGMTEHLGEILDNRAAIFLQLGRGSEALAARETAASIFDEAKLTLPYAKALANVGETQLHLGNYVRGLEALERSRRLLDSLDALADEHLLMRDMGNAYLELNLYSDAIAAYRDADTMILKAGMAHDRARVLWGMGAALAARSEFGDAWEALDEAASLFDRAGNTPLHSGVLLEQASLLEVRGERDGALATAFRALRLVSGDEWPVQRAYAHLRLADLLLPDTNEAELHLTEARRLIGSLSVPHLRYRLEGRLGRTRLLQGRQEEARYLLEKAVAGIEKSRDTVAQETMRSSFLRDKTDPYEDLLRLHLDRGDDESVRRAFAVAEQAKSRTLVDLLAGTGETPSGPGDGGIESEVQTLQAELNALYNRLLGYAGNEEEPPISQLQSRATELEQEITRLQLRAAVASEAKDPLADFSALENVGEHLPPDVTLLAYHAVGDEIVAFVVTRDHIEAVRNVGSVAKVEELLPRLTAQWDRFRAGEEFINRNMRTVERSTRRILGALYEELAHPLELAGEEDSPRKLVVVPHGSLHQVPFQALFNGERYLLERFEFSYAPSATVYALCSHGTSGPPETALVMSVPDPSIPAVSEEARAVSRHFPGAEALDGEEATLAALEAGAPGREVLHLACHGLFRSDNPMFSALKLGDGWLMATDAMRLGLDDALVTLSACESGRHAVIGGDETLGLTRAFLGAGAATLVVSLWLAQDETTAELMNRWYENLRGGAQRAAALREAQLEIKERYPHPYYWAPFILTGRR